jgi:hypothetical protein
LEISQLLFKDYKTSARPNLDKPKFISNLDLSKLNRTEAYEMTYFINCLAISWGWPDNAYTSSYQHLEKIIKTEVPEHIKTPWKIKEWIEWKYAGQSMQ